MARKWTKSDRTGVRKWAVDDLTAAGLPTSKPGIHQALLSSVEMDRVWDLLRQHPDKFRHMGPAASLVITLQGVLRGPHRTQLMSSQERSKVISRIDALCAELAEEVAALRDDDLGLPPPIDQALDDALEGAFESWEQDILGPSWTEAVLGMTDELERQAETRGDWTLLVEPDANGIRHIRMESVRRSLRSDEAKTSEETMAFVMQILKEDTEAWLQRSIKSGIEPLLWALQDGVRSWASEPQVIHKPSDVSEQWAYVIRHVHWFFRKAFKKNMPEETAIVVRAAQDHARDPSRESSTLTASRVSEIVSSGNGNRQARSGRKSNRVTVPKHAI